MGKNFYYEKIPCGDLEKIYKTLFFKQYKYLFLPEICHLLKNHNYVINDNSKSYILSLNRVLFDHCIYLNRTEHIEKEAVFIIHDIYSQFKIFGFSNEQVNDCLRKIGDKNISYSEIILNHFDTLNEENIFDECLPFFAYDDEKNILTEEIMRLYFN